MTSRSINRADRCPDPREYFHDDEREQPSMYHRRVYVRAKRRAESRVVFNRRGPETGKIMVSYLRSKRHRGALACKADRWLDVLELTSQDGHEYIRVYTYVRRYTRGCAYGFQYQSDFATS